MHMTSLALFFGVSAILHVKHAGTWRYLKIGAGTGLCNDLRQWAIIFEKSNILIGAFRGIPSRHRFLNNILSYLQAYTLN